MSTPTSPSVPTRSNTVRSSWTGTVTRRNTDSEDEAIPNSDSSEVCLVFRKYVDPQTDKADDKSPRGTAAGLEAYVRVLGGLCQCHGQGAEVAV